MFFLVKTPRGEKVISGLVARGWRKKNKSFFFCWTDRSSSANNWNKRQRRMQQSPAGSVSRVTRHIALGDVKRSSWLENGRPLNTIIIITSLFRLLWGFCSYLWPSTIFQRLKMAAKIGLISIDSTAIDRPRWALHVVLWMRDDPVNSVSAKSNNYGFFYWKFNQIYKAT